LSGKFISTYDGSLTIHDWNRVEAVPDDIRVRQPFEKKYAQLGKDIVNSMHAWAEKPLKGKTQDQRCAVF
jgi:hypothetical protein